MGRAPCCDKNNVRKGPWSPEEDAKLKTYIEENGTGGNWIALPQKIGLERCGKSCRLRWLNYLRPNIKHGGFSEEEDNLICKLYVSIGSRWSIIAAQLSGRTDNDIKNYWNTKLKKKLLGKCKESLVSDRRVSLNSEKLSSNSLSVSAMERMQLHMLLQDPGTAFSFFNNPSLWPRLSILDHDDVLPNPSTMQQDAPSALQLPSPYPKNKVPDLTGNIGEIGAKFHMNEYSSVCENTIIRREISHVKFTDPLDRTGSSQEAFNEMISGKSSSDNPRNCLEGTYCFNELDVGQDVRIWWDNHDIAQKSASSSWDSTSAFQPSSIFQDYVTRYGSY